MKKSNMITVFTVFGLIIVFAFVWLAVVPKQVTECDGELILKSCLGNSKSIPVSDITFIPSPIGEDTKMLRICGTKVGSRMSGIFRDMTAKTTYWVYLSGEKPSVAFKYQDKTFLVDSWE